jgi:O-antigen/teichoic acid export membrane protein
MVARYAFCFMTRSVSPAAGAIIMIGMRWTDRLIGLISTLILARLLVPEDFGIVAMASLVIELIDVLLDMGVNITLIQNRDATQEDYNAAWTLRLIQSTVAALVVLACAYPAAEYFQDARVAPVIQVLALSVLLAGCENIGIVNFQKKMEFGVEFHFFFVKRLAAFLLTIGTALWLRSYWALVLGTLSGRALGVGLSYWVHPMRPRLSFSRMGSILAFSTWNLVRGIGSYLNANLHRLVVGRRESSAVMGAYSLGSEIAALPSTELLAPLSRVLLPAFVKLKDDQTQLKRAFLLALGLQALAGIPVAVGLVLVAHELVLALLGEKWIAAIPFIQVIGAVNIVSAISASGSYMLLALSRAKITAFNAWVQVVLFAALAFLAIPEGGALAIAILRLAVAAVGLIMFVYLIKQEIHGLRIAEILGAVWRPLEAAAIMAAILLLAPPLGGLPVLVQLLFKVMLGAAVLGGSVFVLWHLSGRPQGAEQYLLDKILRRWRSGRSGK